MAIRTVVFLSNYFNHHQLPFCNALDRLTEGGFVFVQTQPMEAERVQMGWDAKVCPSYVRKYDEEPEACRRLILDADLVLFGGVDDESYIQERFRAKKPVFRYCERMYKTGQWKAISPRGLWHKYLDHTRRRKDPVYVLCAGGYVADDFRIVHAYRDKMFCWGYFPQVRDQDVDNLLKNKGYMGKTGKIPYLLWTGRMIDWKHPELAVETAEYLRDRGIPFHLSMVGGGAMEETIRALIREKHLEEEVSLEGFQSPEKVRGYMEQADVYLFTSDRQEGWGAVANEAMNSCCALVADHMIGAVPYLVKDGKNGLIYRDGKKEELFRLTEDLVGDPKRREALGRSAYDTVHETWNGDYAAKRLLELGETLSEHPEAGKRRASLDHLEPGAPAPVIRERRMFARLCPDRA